MNSPALVSVDIKAGDSLRLNLGGRSTRLDGFVTVDLEPGSDCVADVSKLPYENGSVSEIYASHILEHFPHTETMAVLREWRRVLKRGGKAFISVPDFDAVVKLYMQFEGMNDFLRNLMYGDQLYSRAFHYTIFTFITLAGCCANAGFEDVRRLEKMPYGLKDCSRLVDTWSLKPISVHVEATV